MTESEKAVIIASQNLDKAGVKYVLLAVTSSEWVVGEEGDIRNRVKDVKVTFNGAKESVVSLLEAVLENLRGYP